MCKKTIIFLFIFLFPSLGFGNIPRLEYQAPNLYQEQEIAEIFQTIEHLKYQIEIDPENYQSYERLALIYDKLGAYEQEIEILEKLICLLPENSEKKYANYIKLARSYILNNQPDKAKFYIDEVEKISPDDKYHQWNAVMYYSLKADYIKVNEYLRKLSKNPEGQDYYFRLYEFVKLFQNKEEAEKMFGYLKKQNPSNAIIYWVLGTALALEVKKDANKLEENESKLDNSIQFLEKAVQLDPNCLGVYIDLSKVYILKASLIKQSKEKYCKQALNILKKAYDIDSKDLRISKLMGYVYLLLEDYDQAIKIFEQMLTKDPNNEMLQELLTTAYNNKAYRIYKSAENLSQGLVLIDKALKLQPNNPIVLSTKAELLYKMGKLEEAYDYILKAVSINPNYQEIQEDLKMIEEALKAQNSTNDSVDKK